MNRKRTVSVILLASSILALTNIFPLTTNIKFNSPASAQTSETETDNQLFYIFKGQRIPLT